MKASWFGLALFLVLTPQALNTCESSECGKLTPVALDPANATAAVDGDVNTYYTRSTLVLQYDPAIFTAVDTIFYSTIAAEVEVSYAILGDSGWTEPVIEVVELEDYATDTFIPPEETSGYMIEIKILVSEADSKNVGFREVTTSGCPLN